MPRLKPFTRNIFPRETLGTRPEQQITPKPQKMAVITYHYKKQGQQLAQGKMEVKTESMLWNRSRLLNLLRSTNKTTKTT